MDNKRIPAVNVRVKKIWLLALVLMTASLGNHNALAMDLMGPPTAVLEKGMFRGGIEYAFSDSDVDLIEGKATIYRNGVLLGTGTVDSITIKGLEVNTLYASVGYGIFDDFEAFLRLGIADATYGDSLWDEGEDFDSGKDLAIGIGIKATFYEGFDWKIGGLIQINKSELDGEVDSSAWVITQPHFAQIDTTEMQIALGGTYLYSERVTFYGGPFAYYISGDFDYKFTRITANLDTGKYSWDINDGPIFGGYLGAKIEIAENFSGNIEIQHNSNANVFGINLMAKY